MTDSNLQNTVPEGAFGIGSKKTDDFTKNEELRNTGIQDIPNMLINALTKQSGGIVMPSQITEQTVTNFQEGVENVPLLRKEDEQTVRAGLAAGFDLTENAINFAGRAIGGLTGNKYTAKDFFNNEALGVYIPEEDENSLSYNLTKLGVQYGIPYTAAFKFLGSIGISNLVWKDVLAGGTTTSVFFDTFDKNLSNYLVDTPLVGPVAKLLAAESEEESNVAKETIKKFIEGGVTAKIANKTFDAVLNPQKVSDAFINVVDFFKKSPQATKRLIFNLQQSKFNKFSNIRKYNSMDEVLRVGDDLVDVAPVTDDVVTKTSTGLELPDTRGQNEFYHGAASEINLVEGGEFGKAVENLYGDGFYVTEDLITAAKYQKKNRVKGKKPTGVVYKVTEKQPVKFFDLDAPATPERIDQLRKFYDFGDYESVDIIDRALDEIGPNASIAQIYDQIKLISNANDLSANTTADLFSSFIEELQREGFGGLTHQGGKKAGKSKRLHQVRIYFDPANSLDINKVDLDALADPKVQTTFNPKFTGGGDPDVQKLIIDRAKKLKELDANNAWPYKRTFKDMVISANSQLPQETIESARLFNARYGRGGEEDLPATLIAMNQLMNRNAINLASLAKTIDETLATGNKSGLTEELKEQFITEAKVLDGLITLNKPLKTVPAQTLAANRAGGGVGNVAASIDDLAGRTPAEKAIDQATDIRGTVKEPTDPLGEFSIKEIIEAAEKGDKASWKRLRIITKKLQAAQGNPQALQKMASESKFMRGVKIQNEIFINSILSGPETHAVNVMSTALNTLARPLENTLGSVSRQGFDQMQAMRGGKELYYLMASITDSLKAAKQAFQIEDNIVNPGAMIQEADRFQIRMEGNGNLANMINGLGTIIRLPGRFLLAEDEFFKQLNFRAYVKASAWEDGMRKGLQGAELQRHIKEQFDGTIEIVNKNSMANIKDQSVLDLYEAAQKYAAETTFTADLPEDSLGAAIQGVSRHPFGRVVLPFVRTPVNIFKAQVRRTPGVNMALKEYRQALRSADPSVAAKARGEMYLGGAIWSIAGATAFAINDPMSELAITGGGPSDFNMLNQKRATGWQPYSFRFLLKDEDGNVRMGKDGKPRYKYVSFRRLDPWASFLMMAGDAAAITGGLSKQDRDDFGVAASVALGRNITNKTYLQGITELADLLGKPQFLQNWLARRAAATVNPFSALGRSVKRNVTSDKEILDKKVRAGDDGFIWLRKFHNELATTVPGYSGNLRPMRNFITGSIIEYPVGYGPDTMSVLNPIKETSSINNTVLTTLDEIGARITQPSDELTIAKLASGKRIGSGIELTYDEHLDLIEETAFVKINGLTMVKALHNRIQQKDFQALMKSVRGELIEQNNMDIEVQAQEANRDLAEGILSDIVDEYKKAGKQIWLSKNPERELEYRRVQSQVRRESNEDILRGFEALTNN